jgi:peroxiredoxin
LKFPLFHHKEGERVMSTDVAAEIKVGDVAPDFTLKDQDQKDIKLSDYRGKKNVVLAFYPLDWSPVCTGENKC